MKFTRLFDPIQIGKVNIKNRIAMAPMNNSGAEQFSHHLGSITRRCIDYFVERAKGGVGHIITGVFKVENIIEQTPWPLLQPGGLNALGELVDTLHAYNCRLFIQLSAGAGRNLMPHEMDMGLEVVSASAVPSVWRPEVMCRPLTVSEIKQILDAYTTAARLVQVSGIDGIEVHGHEGYLIDQFTTSLFNTRDDEYGGDLQGRLRFPIDILKAIRDGAKDIPVTYRIGVKHYIKDLQRGGLKTGDFIEKGRDIDESKKIVQYLDQAGYDGFHLDTGCYDSWYWAHPPIYQDHGCSIELMSGFKEITDKPILTANRLDSPEIAENAIRDGKADIIAIGRGLLADPYWPNKVQEGRIDEIRPCIGCQDACLNFYAFWNRPLSCSVNPLCGRERRYPSTKTDTPKKVIIIGGGVAGMEVARMAAVRGHNVALYERESELGGHLREGSVPDFKKDVKRLLDWYILQMAVLKIKVNLGVKIDSKSIEKMKPDVVVVAIGSTPSIPDVPGIGSEKVIAGTDLLLNRKSCGNKVCVIGAGLEGCEIALWLAQKGKKVEIIEILDEPMKKHVIFKANKDMLLDLLDNVGVEILLNTGLKEVTDKGIIVDSRNGKKHIECDNVVLATGLIPKNQLYHSLVNNQYMTYLIGDCKEPRKIHDAIWEGFNVGYIC